MGKQSNAQKAAQKRKYQEELRRRELERQKKQNRLMWQIVIGATAAVLLLTVISLVISCATKKATMDDLDFSPVALSDCKETDQVTDLVRMNITYTDKDGVEQTGDVIVRLYKKVAPITVKNFQNLVKEGFYYGLTFHRVYSGFMIQGGDPKGNGTGYTDQKIKGEFTANGFKNDLKHLRGVLSMARGKDNNSASCQFFICDTSNPHLDGKYATFGYVVAGLGTIDSITSVSVGPTAKGEQSVPKTPIVMEKVCFVRNVKDAQP